MGGSNPPPTAIFLHKESIFFVYLSLVFSLLMKFNFTRRFNLQSACFFMGGFSSLRGFYWNGKGASLSIARKTSQVRQNVNE